MIGSISFGNWLVTTPDNKATNYSPVEFIEKFAKPALNSDKYSYFLKRNNLKTKPNTVQMDFVIKYLTGLGYKIEEI